MTNTDFSVQLAVLRPVLHYFTRRFTRDRDESFDLVQETILKALIHKNKFQSDTNLKGWLFTIMRNTYINTYRRSRREKTSHDTSKELYFLNVEDEHTFSQPHQRLEFREIWQNVNEVKAELMIPFKMYTTGYKYHEIAEALHLPIGTVKNRIFHARKEIQKKLHGYI